MNAGPHFPLIIAAAGRSVRFGRPKLLETVPVKGITLIEHVVRECISGGAGPIVVVLGPASSAPFGELGSIVRSLGAVALHVEPAPEEMRHSIESGIRYLEGQIRVGDTKAPPKDFGFMPADLPGIAGEFVRRLIDACLRSTSTLFRATTPEGRGLHPVAMKWSEREALMALPNECGPNQLWRNAELSRTEFVYDGERMRYDLDIPQDWEKFPFLRDRAGD